jgi:tRNA pseudouridine55 synthase
LDGVLNINKPSGPTSHDVVASVRRILKEKRVGHAGTLDPLATGVLVVCVGKATRIVEYLVAEKKEYRAEMVLGRTTTTEDVSGEVLAESDASGISREDIEGVLPQFTGKIMQVPPMVSAVKYQGERLYKLARKDIQVERQPREVTIHELEITSFDFQDGLPLVGLRVVCSSGTYIRTICADIGAALGVGGYMNSLVRTRVGSFVIEDALELESLSECTSNGGAEELLLPMDKALESMPAVVVDATQSGIIAHGGKLTSTYSGPDGSVVRLKSPDGVLLALGKVTTFTGGCTISPEKVFVEAGK